MVEVASASDGRAFFIIEPRSSIERASAAWLCCT